MLITDFYRVTCHKPNGLYFCLRWRDGPVIMNQHRMFNPFIDSAISCGVKSGLGNSSDNPFFISLITFIFLNWNRLLLMRINIFRSYYNQKVFIKLLITCYRRCIFYKPIFIDAKNALERAPRVSTCEYNIRNWGKLNILLFYFAIDNIPLNEKINKVPWKRLSKCD